MLKGIQNGSLGVTHLIIQTIIGYLIPKLEDSDEKTINERAYCEEVFKFLIGQ